MPHVTAVLILSARVMLGRNRGGALEALEPGRALPPYSRCLGRTPSSCCDLVLERATARQQRLAIGQQKTKLFALGCFHVHRRERADARRQAIARASLRSAFTAIAAVAPFTRRGNDATHP